jgi:hypothetical protein
MAVIACDQKKTQQCTKEGITSVHIPYWYEGIEVRGRGGSKQEERGRGGGKGTFKDELEGKGD